MNLLIYLVIGAIVGSIASQILHINSWLGRLVDMIEGAVGAFLAGYFISPLLKLGTIHDTVTIPTLLITLAGSVIMIWIIKAVHRHNTDDHPVIGPGQMNKQR